MQNTKQLHAFKCRKRKHFSCEGAFFMLFYGSAPRKEKVIEHSLNQLPAFCLPVKLT
jgi:hypothetical protein